MRSTIVIIMSTLFMLLVDNACLAQRPRGTLRGTVRATGNVDPAVVRVQLRQSGVPIQDMIVHESGFEFTDLAPGRYSLIASAMGFDTVVEDVEVPGAWPVVELHAHRMEKIATDTVSVWDLKIPRSARRQFEAAKKKLVVNNYADALVHLKKAVHSYAEYGDAHNVMGQCYAELNQFEAAEQEYKLALEQPHTPELHLLLANVYARENEHPLQARQLELYAEEKPAQHRN